MKKKYLMMAAGMMAVSLLTGCAFGNSNYGLSKKNPTVVTIWNYYNGAQKETFDRMVQEFNSTVGLEKGIIVEAVSKGTINELMSAVNSSMKGEVGAPDMPDAFGAYADTAYEVDKAGKAVDISKYLTEEEMDQYVAAYIDEGRFDGTGIKLFPVAKSTELLAVNKTDWDKFASACSVPEDSLSTWEGIADAAELYYEWTDSLTEVPEDGKAMFGRDAFANYMIIGSKQLGHEIYKVDQGIPALDFHKATMKKLWENYYVPYINGYYGAYGKFRSDDVKTGQLIAIVCSTSGLTYFPNDVTLEDGTNYKIDAKTFLLPDFEGTTPCAVQQGAGMLVVASTEKREYATIEFLKWFTEIDNNIEFSTNSGYLPVKKEANSADAFNKIISDKGIKISDIVRQSVDVGMDIVGTYELYTTKAFKGGQTARDILNSTLDKKAQADREEVIAMMADGSTRKEAVAAFDNDSNFEVWYNDTLKQLEQIGDDNG